MNTKPSKEEMIKAIHRIFRDDKDYHARLMSDLNEEEYKKFLEECPEFLEDIV